MTDEYKPISPVVLTDSIDLKTFSIKPVTKPVTKPVLTDSSRRRDSNRPKKMVLISNRLEVNSYKSESPPRERISKTYVEESMKLTTDNDLKKAGESLREMNVKRPSVMTKWRTIIFCVVLISAIVLLLFIILFYLHRNKHVSTFKYNGTIADITIVRTPTEHIVL